MSDPVGKHRCLRPMMPFWIIFMTLKASAAFLRLAAPPQTKFKIVSLLSLLHLHPSQLAPYIHLIKHKILPLLENLDIVSDEVFPQLVVYRMTSTVIVYFDMKFNHVNILIGHPLEGNSSNNLYSLYAFCTLTILLCNHV